MDAQKLAKVLAMAASDNETEALHALRMAKRLLASQGLDFVALAARLNVDAGIAAAEALEDAVFELRNEIRHLRAENERLRQSRPAAPEAPSFREAARDAAEMIRLRAELDAARAEMDRVHRHEATLHEQFRQALNQAGDLGLRLSEMDGRRLRLEAENRRFNHANHALKVELAQAQGQLAQAQRGAAEMVVVTPESGRIRGKKPANAGQRMGQYALF